jgi:hypothetical protein
MRFIVFIIFLSFFFAPSFVHAQSDKKQREYDKKRELKKKEAEQKYFEAVKQHYKSQSPEVRKQMKKQFKESRRIAENRKKFFLTRWYNNIFNKRKVKKHQENNNQKA